ncbi:orotidine-5'-phosphate decarboxylase [Ferrovum sp.]|uniref:orotidine-5'-phosphate decarboxylase n=1 Tax=Ferrovum sp. TaxID=2609467 RepID=UPI0026306473|nr:orotidine-5'-phosphate decarboxylase [Ferrovum sp.]
MNSPLILALDFSTEREVWTLVDQLEPGICRLKVGKELFTACGPSLVRALVARGFDVFLDLKYHDIPHTVAQACRAAADLGVWMVDVHASGGGAMLEAARHALEPYPRRPLLIAITILTSLQDDDLVALGFGCPVTEAVQRLARLAEAHGLDGVVCSAREAPLLRAQVAASFRLVTPGIRLPEDERDDQKRVVTPVKALQDGSDYLVVGRSITRSEDPMKALAQFNSLISGARSTV